MFGLIRNWLDRRIIKQSSITDEQWDEIISGLPLLRGLTPLQRRKLCELATLLMHRKAFEGAQGMIVTRGIAMNIALQACLPILTLDMDYYRNWYSVIVYPSGFRPKRILVDENGIEHQEQEHLLGESWQHGPVILAWDAAEQGGHIDGQNLVIHEFAHKLDMLNGVANGFPPLHKEMDRENWVKAFSAGYDDFQQRCERGEQIGIDYYASTSPAEFFAVLSEVFFERPDVIERYYTDIYLLLKQFYRQDPLQRLKG